MSDVLKMIENFPRGCSARSLMRLRDIDLLPRERLALLREIDVLARENLIELGRDGKWRAKSRRPVVSSAELSGSQSGVSRDVGDPLLAAPARFGQIPVQRDTPGPENETVGKPNPQALLRYYRSALRADPRGALTQSPDRHGSAFQLVAGTGRWWGGEESLGEMRLQLDQLPSGFREALSKREANENTLAVGWPLAVGRKSGAPAIRPVGLLAAEWQRKDGALTVTIETDDVLVNPDWIKAAARSTSWTEAGLNQIFLTSGGAGLPRDDFLERLQEAMAKSVRGSLQGVQLASMLEPEAEGIHDALALFLPTDSSFTAGAVRDLDQIATWQQERLSRTALAPFLEFETTGLDEVAPAINVGPLNAEQIDAVRSALQAPLTVVTGPPGTGKSQAIVAMVASALAADQRVLVASKNHQALDAVEARLLAIASNAAFMVRTLNPAKEVDVGFRQVLEGLVRDSTSAAAARDASMATTLKALSEERTRSLETIKERRRLNLLLADHIERRDAIAAHATAAPVSATSARQYLSWFIRLLAMLRLVNRSKTADVQESVSLGSGLRSLDAAVIRDRSRLKELDITGDPVALTDRIAEIARKHLPLLLSNMAAVNEESRLDLNNALRDLQLTGEIALDRDLVERVLDHRPLWLASVLGSPKRIDLHDGLFDLVIFDEASQCDIASALPLLARAHRAVVVGDDRQLAFIPQIGSAQDRNLMAAQGLPSRGMGRFAQGRVSLFDFARSTPNVPAIMLRDQYRSSSDIVGYINEQFYGGKLRVSADLDRLKVPEGSRSSLAWNHVTGQVLTGVRNVNPAEVEAIRTHLKRLLMDQGYGGTVGVIAPFRTQVHAIETALRETLPVDLVERSGLRVATVDGFQGQERDLILFSPTVCAGSAQSGVVFLQREWRRLNVAISRARAAVHIFGDLDYARSGKITTLQKLAARSTEPRKRSGEGVFDSDWERVVDAALRHRGLDPKPQYEVAGRRLDFALFGGAHVKLDLEVDGRIFHQDIDGNRKLDDIWRDHQMRSMGWKIRRFWVDELKQDMEGCLDLVEQDLGR